MPIDKRCEDCGEYDREFMTKGEAIELMITAIYMAVPNLAAANARVNEKMREADPDFVLRPLREAMQKPFEVGCQALVEAGVLAP